MSVLRRAKLRTPDGAESIEYPLGVEAENVEVANGENLSQRLARIDEDLEKNEEDIAAVNELAGINKQNIGANEIRIDALERRSASVNKKPYYFDTVADMKAYQELKAGDMVITLGYYEANDGGGAYYIIKNTNITDKINIITLENGLQAHLIIENNTINYKIFGAKLNGTDDSSIIKQVHDFANENNYDIVQNGGNLKCNFTTTVKTNLKLNCNLLIDDDTPNIVFDVVHDLEEIETPLNLRDDLQIINNVLLFNKFCCPISDDDTSKIGNRNNPVDKSLYYHKQPLAVNNAGEILTSSQFIPHSATFHLLGYSNLNEKGVIIEGGKIIVNLSKIGFPSLFRLWRNNSIIKNFDVILQDFGNKEKGRYPYGLFLSWAGCHQIFDNITAINNALNDNDDYSYIFLARYSWNILIENCNFSQGWGNIALFWTDGITFKNCTSNRFDNHYGSFGNLSILDCILTGIGKIRIGYGNGQLLIDNLKINKKNYDAIIETRNDFNIIFQGTIKVQNITDIEDYTVSLVDIANSEKVNDFPNVLPTTIISNVNLLEQRRYIRSRNNNRIQCFINNCQNVPIRSEGDIELYVNNCRIVNIIENSSRIWLTACEVATDNMNLNRLYAKSTEFRNNITLNGLSVIIGCHLTAQCTEISNNSEEIINISNCFSDNTITKNSENIRVINCNAKIPE